MEKTGARQPASDPAPYSGLALHPRSGGTPRTPQHLHVTPKGGKELATITHAGATGHPEEPFRRFQNVTTGLGPGVPWMSPLHSCNHPRGS